MTHRRAPAVFRAILALYPPAYRHQLGADVLDTHLDRLADARGRGRATRVVTLAAVVFDLLAGAGLEWGSLVQSRLPRDLRVAIRALLAKPGYSAVIVLTLALSIGANTAVFSLIDAVLLRPVSVAHPEQVVAIYSASPRSPNDGVAYPVYKTLAGGSKLLSGLAASMTRDVSMDLGNRTETASAVVTSGNYFSVLGLQPQVGRLLQPSDEGAPLASPVAVLSDATWDRLYARRADAIGSTVKLGNVTFTIVGVAPRGFHGTDLSLRQDVWVPVTMIQGLGMGGMFSGRFGATILTTFDQLGWLQLVGRMQPGATSAQVAAEVTALMSARAASLRARPPGATRAVSLSSAATVGSHDTIVTFTRLLGGVVTLMLVLACANVASLLGVRAAGREREVGVSVALGASRARIVGQMLLESGLLAGIAGLLGIAVGRAFMAALSSFSLPGGLEIDTLKLSLDPRVLTFALVLSVATTVLCGLWPALRAAKADPIAALRSQLRSGWTREPRGAMVALQVAIVIVIVASAGLFVRSLRAGLSTDLGFDPDGLVAGSVELRLSGYTGPRAAAFYTQVSERLSARPGITRAAIMSAVPLDPTPPFDIRPGKDGVPVLPAGDDPVIKAVTIYVTPGYFETLRVPVVDGREFSPTLTDKDAEEVILNESAVRALWPDHHAIGRHVIDLIGSPGVVVGVVRDMKYATLTEHDVPCIYYSAAQQMVSGRMFVMARGQDDAQTLASVRSVISDVDPHLPVGRTFAVHDYVNRWMAPQRFGSALLSVFGFVALVVSGIGIYSTLAWRIVLRRQELGVRLALGASGAHIVGTVLRRTGRAVLAGMAVGLVAALAVARTFNAFLFGVTWTDPIALVSTVALVGLAVALVVAGPLRDALRTDPLVAMRSE